MRNADRIRTASASGAPCHDAQLFERYARYVAFIGRRVLGGQSDADDLVQQVFLAAFKRREQLRDPAAAKGWLATIAVRTAHRQRRRQRLRKFVGLDDRAVLELRAQTASPESCALLARVDEILARLPFERRLAWTLRYVEGQKLEFVAERCGCSLTTAKCWIAATQAHLRAEMNDG
jgi:RNA polymerase sigma-70 factor (ECF subfamily)